jgi:RNA polymerase sigma factor (sigma-70 family)
MEFPPDTDTERRILRQIAQGDGRAFAELVGLYAPQVYGHIIGYLKNVPDTEDQVQEIFLKVWNAREKLNELKSFKDWLFIMTRNATISGLRKKLLGTEGIDLEEIPAGWLTSDASLEYKQTHQILMEGINSLSPRKREIFMLTKLEGKSYQEVAGLLGITKGNINKQMVEALAFLRQHLKDNLGGWMAAVVLIPFL